MDCNPEFHTYLLRTYLEHLNENYLGRIPDNTADKLLFRLSAVF